MVFAIIVELPSAAGVEAASATHIALNLILASRRQLVPNPT
jgi:hypothetical protein